MEASFFQTRSFNKPSISGLWFPNLELWSSELNQFGLYSNLLDTVPRCSVCHQCCHWSRHAKLNQRRQKQKLAPHKQQPRLTLTYLRSPIQTALRTAKLASLANSFTISPKVTQLISFCDPSYVLLYTRDIILEIILLKWNFLLT